MLLHPILRFRTPIYAVTAPKCPHLPASTMLWRHLLASAMLCPHLPAITAYFVSTEWDVLGVH